MDQNTKTMALSPSDVKNFQGLYKCKFGVDLCYKDAYERAVKLFEMMKIIYMPMTKNEYALYK